MVDHLEQESNRQKTMVDIDGGLHHIVEFQGFRPEWYIFTTIKESRYTILVGNPRDGQSLCEDEDMTRQGKFWHWWRATSYSRWTKPMRRWRYDREKLTGKAGLDPGSVAIETDALPLSHRDGDRYWHEPRCSVVIHRWRWRSRLPDQILFVMTASLMSFAWIFCAGFGIIMARYYKPLWPKHMLCGRKVWFTVSVKKCCIQKCLWKIHNQPNVKRFRLAHACPYSASLSLFSFSYTDINAHTNTRVRTHMRMHARTRLSAGDVCYVNQDIGEWPVLC